ncbi:MAG TPA: SurA N-terminal domain-containing protein [Xanthomonadaceae bacterium]|nr:SurA N-terminal domain-containing protein [Xanthomonadaceae bacterium]
MLQKLTDKSSSWIAKLILVLLAVPFAFFGMEQYFTQRIDTWAARVAAPPAWWTDAPSFWPVSMLWREEVIDANEFREAFEQERQRRQLREGEAFDPRAFDTMANKQAVLDRLVDQRVLQLAADRAGIAIGDAQVRDSIQAIQSFQVDGRFDAQQYQLVLASQVPPLTPRGFEQEIREGLRQSLVVDAVAASAFATGSQVEQVMRLLDERRDVAWVVLQAPDAAAEATPIDDAAVQAWYDAHLDDYRSPERVAVEYIAIDADALEVPIVDEAALRAQYEAAGERFSSGDERLASHILVQGDDDTDAAQARAEAERIAALARQPGADFAALAREHSDDVGSRASGGDLGWITRGTMGDAIDEALFALEPGATSDPVQTEFGWHVLQLRDVKAGEQVPFESVREELAREAEADARERAFNELAGRVVDEVYSNPSDLGAAAAIAGVPVQASGLFARGAGNGIAAHPAVQRVAFSEALVEDGMVSDPIEIEPGHTVLLRVVEHVPEQAQPLAEVRAQVVEAVRAARVAEALEARARELVSGLDAAGDLAATAEAQGLAVMELPALPRGAPVPGPEAVEAIFAVAPPEAGKVSPGYVVRDGNAVVFVVRGVTPGEVPPAGSPEREMVAMQLARLAGNDEAEAYVAALRERMEVEVAEDRL